MLRRCHLTQKTQDFFRYTSFHPSETREERTARLERGIKNVIDVTFEKLDQLQSLRVDNADFQFPFQYQINEKSTPLPMFASLKTLFVSLFGTGYTSLTGRNVVWLLIQCQNLKTASLGCTMSSDDFRFLEEHSEAFTSLSNVEHLALHFSFIINSSDRRTLWVYPNSERVWKGGNKKTESVIHLFSVLKNKNLTSLALAVTTKPTYPDDGSHLSSSCLSGLQSSFSTLRHLNLFAIRVGAFSLQHFQLDLLHQLRILSMEHVSLAYLLSSSDVKVSQSLETLVLPFHTALPFTDASERSMDLLQGREEKTLARLLKEKAFSNLKTVIIPSEPTDISGSEIKTGSFTKNWSEGVRELEKLGIFTSGRANLRRVKFGELHEGSATGEGFVLGHPWLSMP